MCCVLSPLVIYLNWVGMRELLFLKWKFHIYPYTHQGQTCASLCTGRPGVPKINVLHLVKHPILIQCGQQGNQPATGCCNMQAPLAVPFCFEATPLYGKGFMIMRPTVARLPTNIYSSAVFAKIQLLILVGVMATP